ncbi:MAG: hypothetical protein M3Y91_14230 [Actinomycetota bacterium]|nr:hypothetical protein [Actinomycetota bacterium]
MLFVVLVIVIGIGLVGLSIGPVALFKIRGSRGTRSGRALAAVGMASALTVFGWIGFCLLVIVVSNMHFTM